MDHKKRRIDYLGSDINSSSGSGNGSSSSGGSGSSSNGRNGNISNGNNRNRRRIHNPEATVATTAAAPTAFCRQHDHHSPLQQQRSQDGENNGETSLADEIRRILLSISLEDKSGFPREQEDIEDDLWDALGPLYEREEENRGHIDRRPANQSIPNANSQYDRRRRSCPPPSFSTMKDLAVFLVYNVHMDVLNKLRILTWDYDALSLDRFKVREKFLESLTDRGVEDVRSICLREERHKKILDSQQSEEEYRREINVVDIFFRRQKLNDWDCIQKTFFPISVEELTRAISNVAAPRLASHEPTNGLAEYSVSHQPTKGLAAYSYMGTHKLAEALQDILRCEVTIRHRCLVVVLRWADLPHKYHRNIALFQKSEVQLWTREMMEPTISAILPYSLSPPGLIEI